MIITDSWLLLFLRIFQFQFSFAHIELTGSYHNYCKTFWTKRFFFCLSFFLSGFSFLVDCKFFPYAALPLISLGVETECFVHICTLMLVLILLSFVLIRTIVFQCGSV